ncbi:MAG: gluconolactonase [Glaciecola sp.]|jgi:gluconolactonase
MQTFTQYLLKYVTVSLLWAVYALHTANAAAPSVQLIATQAHVIEVASGFGFLEGPVADQIGNLFFTDINNNTVHKMNASGQISAAYSPSNHANGLTLDLDGSLLICEQSGQRISKLAADGSMSTVVDTYAGKPFNSPNDLWVNPNGSIYFTDPRYNFPPGEISQDGEYVYLISQDRSHVLPVITDIPKPNGVVGTEDGKHLYIASTELRKVFRFDINADGSLDNKIEFADQGSDGMTLDQQGNVYLTWVGGVSIRNPQGEQIEFIETPQMPANVGFGGADGKTLFMTARTSLYSIKMNVTASR